MHRMLMKELLYPARKLTDRKLFGQYEHEIVKDAAIIFRIMPLSFANTEDEERGFTFLKKVAKDCSNHHPENVLTSCIIRTQVREDWNVHLGTMTKEETNNISKHSMLTNSALRLVIRLLLLNKVFYY